MSGSIFGVSSLWRAWLVALCACGGFLSGVAVADDDDRGRRKEYRSERAHHGHHRDHRHQYRSHQRKGRGEHRRAWREYDGRDGHYHEGRYWAPPRYRGRRCTERRHYHSVHFHVAAEDYYDYYYPRYRSYGAYRPGVDASVIITLPLF